uniref:Uncharacterized protein n=1 Tax=viral metagenome TaxID=1070528 RepID=A0A6C0CVX3_9ZZZZ
MDGTGGSALDGIWDLKYRGILMVGNENGLLLGLPQCSINGFLLNDNIVMITIHNSNSKYTINIFILYTIFSLTMC